MIKKIITVTIIIFALFAFALFSVLFFIDYKEVSKNFATHLKINPQNINTIKVNKFPIPYLIIDSIKEEGKIELEAIKIQFSPWSLLMFRPQISSINISNAKIYLANKDFNIINHDKLISTFITSNTINVNLNILNLSILTEQNQPFLTLTNCSLFKTNPLSSTSLFKGSVDNLYEFSGSFDKDQDLVDFHFNLNNNDYSFKLTETYKDSKLLNGNGEYLIKNLANVLHYIVPDLTSSFKKFNKKEIVNIKFDILPTDDLLKLDNVNINSNSFSGSGVLNFSKNNNLTSLIELHFPKIDIRSLITSSNENQLDNKEYGIRFNFGNKSVKTDISIEQIIINDTESLNKIDFSSNLEGGILNVKDFSGTIASGGRFQLVGNVTQNSVRSIFDGKIYLTHNDLNSILNIMGYSQATVKSAVPFILSSDLTFTLIDVYLQNLLLKTDITKVTGNISTKFIGTIPHLIAVLEFSSLDLNKKDYPIISPIIEFTKNLTKNMKDDGYLNKFIPVRAISYLGNLDITINNTTFADTLLGKVNLLIDISPGNIQISNFDIRKGEDYLTTSWDLVASNLKPKLSVKIEDGSFNVNFLNPTSLLSFRNKLLNEFSLDKILLNLDCSLSKIYQGDLILENLKFSINNDNNLLKIDNLECNILSGKLKGEGNILLDPYTISFVYALNSIDLAKLSAILPKGPLNTIGGASINGSISTSGDTLEKLLYNLQIQSKFAVDATKINNLGIDTLIEKLNSNNYNLTNFQADLTKALTSGNTEIINLLGDLTLDKGIATLKNIQFNTKYSSGAASLVIDIYNFKIDLSSLLSFYIINTASSLSNVNNKNTLTTLNIDAIGTIFDLKKNADSTKLKKVLDSMKPNNPTPLK